MLCCKDAFGSMETVRVFATPNQCAGCFDLLTPDALLPPALFWWLCSAVRVLWRSRLFCTKALQPTWLPLTIFHWLSPWFGFSWCCFGLFCLLGFLFVWFVFVVFKQLKYFLRVKLAHLCLSFPVVPLPSCGHSLQRCTQGTAECPYCTGAGI